MMCKTLLIPPEHYLVLSVERKEGYRIHYAREYLLQKKFVDLYLSRSDDYCDPDFFEDQLQSHPWLREEYIQFLRQNCNESERVDEGTFYREIPHLLRHEVWYDHRVRFRYSFRGTEHEEEGTFSYSSRILPKDLALEATVSGEDPNRILGLAPQQARLWQELAQWVKVIFKN